MQTSREAARAAGRVLQDPTSTPDELRAAASALNQRKPDRLSWHERAALLFIGACAATALIFIILHVRGVIL